MRLYGLDGAEVQTTLLTQVEVLAMRSQRLRVGRIEGIVD